MAKTPRTPPKPLAVASAARKPGRTTSAKPRAPRAKKPPVDAVVAAEELISAARPAAPEPATATPEPETGSGTTPQNPFGLPGEEQRQMIETLSLNLARAAMTAQAAIAEAALAQADRPAALSSDPLNVGPAMNSVMASLAARPDKLFTAQADLFNRYMDLWATTARRVSGEEAPQPSKDKRFKDPAWLEKIGRAHV